MTTEAIRAQFRRRFDRDAEAVARAPGRVNLIGEHTDYNDGFVLPMAVVESTWVAAAARGEGRARICSEAIAAEHECQLAGDVSHAPAWARYILGVAALLQRRRARLDGFDLLISSEIPIGGGMSSSAALCVATFLALAYLAGEPLLGHDVIDLSRQVEHEFAGVKCGLMDPTAVLLGKADCALRLDCRSREIQYVQLRTEGCAWVLIDSGVRHRLADGEYGRRQDECALATQYFAKLKPGVRALRDVSSDLVRAHAQQLDPTAAARALHVTSENERVLAAVEALRANRLVDFGKLLRQSHRSLRDQFQVSCRELDDLFEGVNALPGVHGARMTGAGFGGCLIGLARESAVDGIRQWLATGYNASHEKPATLSIVRPGAGAEIRTQ